MRWTNMMSASKTFKKVPTQSLSAWPTYDYPAEPRHAIAVTLTDKYPRASYWLKNPTSQHSAVLTSYTWGNDSVKLEAVDAVWLHRQRMLASVFPLMSSESASVDAYTVVQGVLDQGTERELQATIDWQSQKGFHGGFKLDQPGDYYYTSSLAFHYRIADNVATTIPAQLVYLTGCSISFLGGWIEGAMMSGINVATAILHRCLDGLNPNLRSAPLLRADAMPFHTYQEIGAGATVPPPAQQAEPALAK
jgi:tryptophan 2-monooxygenase